MSRPRIVMASGNPGKLKEIARLLEPLELTVVPQSDFEIPEAIEDGATFEANAIIKARHAAELTGLPAIADDSGLAVDVLDGRPGVYSARYAGVNASDDDNIDKLLAELGDRSERTAAFHCVACYAEPGSDEVLLGRGEWRGEILRARQGAGGFGYDPVFFDPVSGLAAAELTPEQKNARSHRGQALAELVAKLGARR